MVRWRAEEVSLGDLERIRFLLRDLFLLFLDLERDLDSFELLRAFLFRYKLRRFGDELKLRSDRELEFDLLRDLDLDDLDLEREIYDDLLEDLLLE